MFKALAYLTENGGEDAMATLGDSLIEAVKELASMIANFEQTVEDAKESNQELGTQIEKSSTAMTEMPAWMANQPTPIGEPEPQPAPAVTPAGGNMQELIDILTSGEAIIRVKEPMG